MDIHENILRYMYEKNSIPIWLLSKEGELVYSSVDSSALFPDKTQNKFLQYFRKDSDYEPKIKRLNQFELYLHFIIPECDECLFVIGPAFDVHPMSVEVKSPLSINYLFNAAQVRGLMLLMPTTPISQFCRYVVAISEIFCQKTFDAARLESEIEDYSLKFILDRQLINILFEIREDERMSVYAPELEETLLSYVRRGDIENLPTFRYPSVRDPNSRGTQNQYLFEIVALVTLATRAAVDGGLDPVDAYHLSDLYLKQLSVAKTDKEITAIAEHVIPHFTERVKHANENNLLDKNYSPYIARAIQYIRTHLHYPITLDDVAEQLSINPKYLSRLFITCRGEKFSAYIQRERIAEAKSLLTNTELSIIEISNGLGFSSQSYFIKVFTRYVGMTPGKFLDKKKVYQ